MTDQATNPAATYSPDDLAWFAREYADTEWMVHVTGMECRVRQDPDLDDDDPANPLLTQETALKLADSTRRFNAWYAEKYPRATTPALIPTVFHRGVPYVPEPQIPGQGELTTADEQRIAEEEADQRDAAGNPCPHCDGIGYAYTQGGEETIDCGACGGTGLTNAAGGAR